MRTSPPKVKFDIPLSAWRIGLAVLGPSNVDGVRTGQVRLDFDGFLVVDGQMGDARQENTFCDGLAQFR